MYGENIYKYHGNPYIQGTTVPCDAKYVPSDVIVHPDSKYIHLCFSFMCVIRTSFVVTIQLYCTGIYVGLDDRAIPNHGYVVISDIGSTDDTALICHTNRPATLNNNADSGGDWFASDETRVDDTAVPGFRRTRGPMMVRLLRNTATDPPSEGIYHCLVEDDTLTEQTVYVGLYNSGGGIIHTNIRHTRIIYKYVYMPTKTHNYELTCR